MGIRDMAADAADLAAAEKAAEKARLAEAWRRNTYEQAHAWCSEHLLPPDEVIPDGSASYMGDAVARVRIDDVWLEWHSLGRDRLMPASRLKNEPQPAAQLIWQVRLIPKDGDRLAPDHPSRIMWRTVLDTQTYWIRSLADLGNQLRQAEQAKPRYGFEIYTPTKEKKK